MSIRAASDTPAHRRRRLRASLRVRITGGALIVVLVALVSAVVVVVSSSERAVRSQIDSTLHANVDFIDRSLRSGSALPRSAGPSDLYVQFVAPNGHVVGASTAALSLPALLTPSRDGSSAHIRTVHSDRVGEVRALMQPAPGTPGLTLVVARAAGALATLHHTLMRLLLIMLVLGSGLLCVLVWIVVGRALRPVEEMRRAAFDLSEHALDRRLVTTGSGDELDRLAITLNDLLDRLERAITRERRFVADASHELRTPLAGMRALLETEAGDEAAVSLTRAEALDRLGQLERLVDELLLLASADAPVHAPRLVDLDELVLGTARQLTPTNNVTIDTSAVSAGQVLGRDADLCRLVENLGTNAVRHARTTVRFALDQRDDIVELEVSDDGPGIAPDERSRVFERFATLDDVRTPGAGRFGLGLAIAAAIVSAHDGTIRITDTPSGGARFVVRLPSSTAKLRADTPI